jgi:two-component sensor histidine kinase/CheY-like chemotaxis protein
MTNRENRSTGRGTAVSILAVDDRPDNLYVIRQLIEEQLPRVEVFTAADPAEGLKMAAQHLPDGILLDLKMPGMDGIQLCKRLKKDKKTAHIPIIIITAQNTTPELRESAMAAGADDFISIPIDNVELITSIKVILRLKHAEDQFRRTSDELKTETESRKQVEESLQETTNLNKILMDAMPCVALLIRPGTREIAAANKAAREAGALPGQTCHLSWRRRDTPCPWCLAPAVWAGGKPQHKELEIGGITWDIHWVPVSSELYIHYSFDVTQRKAAEEKIKASLREKEILLKEIHHRAKNNMAVISALLKLQSASFEDPGVIEAFAASHQRIRSMALVHEKLYQAEDLSRIDFSLYIPDLVNQILRSNEILRDRISLDIQVDNILIAIDSAIPCGLIINELVANAIKHAFPGESGGEIRIRFSAVNNRCILTISDNGAGLPASLDFQRTSSFGLYLVKMLTEQLEGEITVDRSGGTSFEITFPRES